MKPAPFGYERPRDLQAALAILGEAEASAKIIAGGQSLGPMLNLRLVEPDLIVDITGLSELKHVEPAGHRLWLPGRWAYLHERADVVGSSPNVVVVPPENR